MCWARAGWVDSRVGGLYQLLLCNFPVCSVDQQVVQIKENSSISEPLLNISVSDGLHVALGSGSTPSTFEIVDNKLFLIVTPDYEVQSVGWNVPPWGHT